MTTLLLASGASAQSNYKSLHTFNGKDGTAPYSTLIFDHAGNIYGTTFIGGHYNFGTIFKLTPNSSGGWNGNTLYSFCWHCNDGGFAPVDGLTLDSAGNLYGTAALGGVGVGGTVFKLTQNSDGTWAESVLYNFCSLANCADGYGPEAGVIFDAAGNLYGATELGGTLGRGTIFKLTPQLDGTWAESVLYSFCNGLTDTCAAGSDPISNPLFDAAGNLYGTTADGGLSTLCAGNGCGVVFKLTPQTNGSWTEKVLHTFNGRDGANSPSSLIFDRAGNLYGTTASGGNLSLCVDISYVNGCGVVFQLTPNADGSWKENVLHRFSGLDGREPTGGLIFDPAGNLYGTTTRGGSACDCGVVFKLAPNSGGGWSETVLHRFSNNPGDQPAAGLTLDTKGNLFGTTQGDLKTTFGSVFEITP
jgi:uncharacterized repeat protein (TIGR03803 family)